MTPPSLVSAIGSWALSLCQLHQRLSSRFARPEVRQHALLYLQAILSEIPRENGWQIAEHARQARPYGMQRLLSQAVWDEDGVRDDLHAWVCQTLHPHSLVQACDSHKSLFPVLVIDEHWLSQTRVPLGWRRTPVLRAHWTRRKLSGRRLPLLRHGTGPCPHRPRIVSARRLVR